MSRPMAKWDRTKGRPEPIAALNKIGGTDNGEEMVDLLKFCPLLLVGRPQLIPYARRTVAEMLLKATQSLPTGYRLGLVEGWRPFARQQRIWKFMWECAEVAHPGLSYAQLRRIVCRWVAPVDQKAPPGHCTGAAVDVFPMNEAGDLLDVTSPFTRFGSAPTYSFGLSSQAQENRDHLVKAMLDAGFSNCRDEWWHYSYGDAGWAVRMGEKECFYWLADLPLELYDESEKIHVQSLENRPNPWLEG